MKINLIILILLVALAGAWTLWQHQKNKPQNSTKSLTHTNINVAEHDVSKEIIRDFSFTLLSGKERTLYSIKNKIIILHFWATWCAPCLVEFPELITLADKTKDDVVILAISTNENKRDIERFLEKLNLDMPANFLIAHDPNKIIAQDMFKTIKLPESFILSPDYKLHKKIIGASDEWSSENQIKALIALNKATQ